MKKIILGIVVSLCVSSAFSQDTTAKKEITIKVPDFAQPHIKAFYIEYSNHLIKCIKAIREKNEARATALFKNPGEQLVARSRILEKEVIMNPVEKEKWMQFAAQVYPYIKELERSSYYQKLYGK
jgi:hypothetical protein